jgi:hypothetical protein
MKVFPDLPASPDPIPLDERNSYRVFNKSLNQTERLSYLECPQTTARTATIRRNAFNAIIHQ